MHLLTAFACLVLAPTASLGLSIRQIPTLPSQDSFYEQPANISDYREGDIIKSRRVSMNLAGILGISASAISIKASYQYLYRTSDSQKNPAAAVTTVLVPNGADPNKLLSYQTAYDSANINCGPSYSFQAGANNTAIVDIIMITAALNRGYYVVSSDYEGLQGAFTSGLQAGYATLDSVRVALSTRSTSETGLATDAKVAMWGYSGGTIASEWAAELQPSYAPELKFEGVALGGLIANTTSVVRTINGSPFAGLAFSGIQGLRNAYPDFKRITDAAFVSDAKRHEFEAIAQGCLLQTSLVGIYKDMSSYFDGFDSLFRDSTLASILNETGQMGQTGRPDMPMYIYEAAGDEVAPAADAESVIDRLCSDGVVIEYRKNLVGGHATEDILGSGSALDWIGDRLAGEPVSNTACTERLVVLSTLDLGSISAFGVELVSLLQNVLGGSLGPLIVSG